MQNPFTLTKESETMSDKIQQLAVQLGVSGVDKTILPDEKILTEIFENFLHLLQHPEISAIMKRQKDGKITRRQMWAEMIAKAEEIDKQNHK
jgi:hypothetical protein